MKPMRYEDKHAVLVGDLAGIFELAQLALLKAGIVTDWFKSEAEFLAKAGGRPADFADVDLILARGSLPIGPALMDGMPRLRGLVSVVTGIEGFDRRAATERGIVIANGKTAENYESMAEATILMALAARYDLPGAQQAFRAGWPDGSRIRGRMLRGCQIGLVGFGAIARAVAHKLSTWEVNIVAYMPNAKPLPMHVRAVELDELMRTSDVIFILAALTADSHHLIDRRRVNLMKPGALLVNTARGGLVDEQAIIDAVTKRHIQVALDAFEAEPLPVDAPIRSLTGSILTPHCVGHTLETLASSPIATIENVMAILAGTPPPYVVNSDVLPRWITQWTTQLK
jgi:phosphoglycerate dehydrogenase-like enzyme